MQQDVQRRIDVHPADLGESGFGGHSAQRRLAGDGTEPGTAVGEGVWRAHQRRRGVEEPSRRVQVLLGVLRSRVLDQQHAAAGSQRLPGAAQRANRVAQVVQAVDEGDQVIPLAGQPRRVGHLEGDLGA